MGGAPEEREYFLKSLKIHITGGRISQKKNLRQRREETKGGANVSKFTKFKKNQKNIFLALGTLFAEYLCDLVHVLDHRHRGKKFILVLDNLRAHQRDLLDLILSPRGHQYIFLPPYSPMLNPVEHCFSIFKSGTKQELVARHREICATDRLQHGQKMAARARILKDIMKNNIPLITPEKVAHSYAKILYLFPLCIMGLDIH